MTITQLEYIVAVDTYRSFSVAADKCFVTQPTLSMQIQKLEEHLGVTLFDRQKKPIVTTEIGKLIIEQSRQTLRESKKIKSIIADFKGELTGEIYMGVLPTIAPYLLPLILPGFIKKYPSIQLKIEELTTEEIIDRLQKDLLDIGILATPIEKEKFNETKLYEERLLLYVSPQHPLYNRSKIELQDINPDDLWLLAKGHCFRNQSINLCELKRKSDPETRFTFESGSIETILRILELQPGITIVPQMATLSMDSKKLKCIKEIAGKQSGREISLISRRSYLKQGTIMELQRFLIEKIPAVIQTNKLSLIPITSA